MKKFISKYTNPNENRINFGLLNKEYDESLVTYIIDTCKSLEVLKYIKFTGYKYITDEHEIEFNNYIKLRKRRNKKDLTRFMPLADSRYNELILDFELTCKGEKKRISKRILVPKVDKDGYYFIKGKKYFLMYQLVDNSTYTRKNSLILKSLMPVCITRESKVYNDITGQEYSAPTYVISIFKKEVNILLFYFAKFGVKKTLEFFSLDKILKFSTSQSDKENSIYFKINSKIFLEINKSFFLNHQYVQTMVFMMLTIFKNRLTFDHLENKEYWTEEIGSIFSTTANSYYDKGLNTLIFFDRMLDETTKRILKISSENKKNIYTIVRWLIQEFNELKKKDILDLETKRLRCNEFIAALLTKEFSSKLNRIIVLGAKVTLDRVEEIFNFPGDILMVQLFKSNLLRYDDVVNDLNFWNGLRFTLRGPYHWGLYLVIDKENHLNCGNILRALITKLAKVAISNVMGIVTRLEIGQSAADWRCI